MGLPLLIDKVIRLLTRTGSSTQWGSLSFGAAYFFLSLDFRVHFRHLDTVLFPGELFFGVTRLDPAHMMVGFIF